MRDEKRAARRRQIEDAAFELLLEKGYAATSMLAVARKAGASNETLYRWYGDKAALFRALVERNARLVVEPLQSAIEQGGPIFAVLDEVGPVLLGMLTSAGAVALNRAAAMDADDPKSEERGALGRALDEAGRGAVRPLFVQLLARRLSAEAADEAAADYLSLLIGDWQTRRISGAMEAPSPEQIKRRSETAAAALMRLYPVLDAG